jgi:hypothetical protein
MEINITIKGDSIFRRSQKAQDKGSIQFMGGTCFVSDVPDNVINGPMKSVTVSADAWSDGSFRAKGWIKHDGVTPKLSS